MPESLRTPFFVVAVLALVLVVLVELASVGFLGTATIAPAGYRDLPTPGYGIPYLALLDGLLLFTVVLMAVSLVVPERVHGRVQGIVTLIFSLLLLLGAILLIFVAIGLLILMVSLLLAVPFGTIAYMAAFSHFSVGAARGTLGALMTLKLVFAVCLVLAQQRFLENKGLVLLILTSLLANIIVSFLHGFVPGFLVSITDDIGAIVVGILAAIWALVFLIGSIPAVIKALRVDRALA
jgi:hypothetical protein